MDCPIEALLQKAAELKASDLHLTAGEDPAVRVHGMLTPLKGFAVASLQDFCAENPDKDITDAVFRLFEPVLPEKQRELLKTSGECDFAFALPSGQRFRINLYYSGGRLAAAIRIIPEKVPSCQALGLPEAVCRLSALQNGLVLVTGATGSGKSTTLAALLQEINQTRAAHIVTLEDPAEYRFVPAKSIIHQREVGNDTVSFASGLRAALREDPDIIMVGELRDLETIAVAITAAETGHLVFATLHTRSASETVNRIIDVFPEQQQRQVRVQLAGSLQAVVTQQLLPDRQGGRTAAFEVMVVTTALRNLIREGKTQQMDSYIQTGKQLGMQTMAEAVERLKRAGKI
ncbi:MAG: PilT/PilU family type 4a pilus ATPase [Acidaminococcaceae bacterium]|nr:PilT/PilU family type 4a pilus ATPase [Acidaminococcaceae bacterium]